jgi:CBS domain-containing protein
MNTEASVREIMSSDVITVMPDDRLMKIESLFELYSIHHLPVAEDGVLLGIISYKDILNLMRNAIHDRVDLDHSAIMAKDIMTENPIALDCEDSIGLAADIFLANKFHSLPVLDGDELAGIVTNHDLLKFCFR